ncbi:MAG: PIN domain-containing protein [Bdellovibrionota bacterium]
MVIDSSVILELLLKRPLHQKCIEKMSGEPVFIPVIAFYECYKKLRTRVSESEALEAMGFLKSTEHSILRAKSRFMQLISQLSLSLRWRIA